MTPATRNIPFVTVNDRASGRRDRAVVIARCQAVENDLFCYFFTLYSAKAVGNDRAVGIALALSVFANYRFKKNCYLSV
jgi:hypothetical protein